jgi:hypothetical protein
MSFAPADLENAKRPVRPLEAVGLEAKRRGDGIRGTTRLCRVLADAASAADVDSARLDYGSPPAEPMRTLGSFGQLLQGDLRRSSGRGSHRPPIAQAWAPRLLGPFVAFQPGCRPSTNVGTETADRWGEPSTKVMLATERAEPPRFREHLRRMSWQRYLRDRPERRRRLGSWRSKMGIWRFMNEFPKPAEGVGGPSVAATQTARTGAG